MAEPLAIWQPFGLHPFFACIFDFGGDPSSKGGGRAAQKIKRLCFGIFFGDFIADCLIHQCEKGMPPTGVCYIFFEEMAGNKQQDL